jgi:hypothetical protein
MSSQATVTRYEQAQRLSTIERAYELARQGPCQNVDEIRAQLDRERYPSVSSHLSGPTLRKQLRQLCRDRLAAVAAVSQDNPG